MDLFSQNLSNLYLYSWCLRQAVIVKLTIWLCVLLNTCGLLLSERDILNRCNLILLPAIFCHRWCDDWAVRDKKAESLAQKNNLLSFDVRDSFLSWEQAPSSCTQTKRSSCDVTELHGCAQRKERLLSLVPRAEAPPDLIFQYHMCSSSIWWEGVFPESCYTTWSGDCSVSHVQYCLGRGDMNKPWEPWNRRQV